MEKCGAGLERIYCKFIEEAEGGNDEMSRSDVINVKENNNSPPETKKEFKEGYWYKCVNDSSSVLITGKYYNVVDVVHEHNFTYLFLKLSLIHISEPTRRHHVSRMPSSA